MSLETIIAALSEPSFYPHHPDAVEHVQTHISHVFLAGPYVYKLKKPVRLSFLDFSTPELRHHFCLEEVRLNRRLCPSVYLGVMSITCDRDGQLALGGCGTVLDHVVWMRRLPERGMLGHLVREGRIRTEMIETLAATVAAFHAEAPTGAAVAAHAAPAALRARWLDNMEGARPHVGRVLAREDYEILADFGPAFVREHEETFRARQRNGRIREGHGDLHAGNVCFVEIPEAAGDLPPLEVGIYIFDCIEFSQAFRCNDVASEVAFLSMDLEWLGRADLARRFVEAYARAAADAELSKLLRFYACYRACVRGKVESIKHVEAEVEEGDRQVAAARARQHFALAMRYAWRAEGAAVIACTGLSGSGKTTVATMLAAATGFDLVSTDVIRKRHPEAGPFAAVQVAHCSGLYSVDAREAVYAALCDEVEKVLTAGRGVIADGTFIAWENRLRLAGAAKRHGAPYVFVECQADEAVTRARLRGREATSQPSDATWETYLSQRQERDPFGVEEPRLVLDTSGDPGTVRRAALRSLWHWRRTRGRRG